VHYGELALLVAFPLRNGRVEPVFIAGLNSDAKPHYAPRLPGLSGAGGRSLSHDGGTGPAARSASGGGAHTSGRTATPVHRRQAARAPAERRAVPFAFQLAVSADHWDSVLDRDIERFVLSYDLWEEKLAIAKLGSPRKSVSHLAASAAEAGALGAFDRARQNRRGAAVLGAFGGAGGEPGRGSGTGSAGER